MVQTAPGWLEELHTGRSSRAGVVPNRPGTRGAADAVAYLAGGMPDPRHLPKDTVIEATRAALEAEGEWALQYGPSAGDPGLIEALLEKLGRDQGISAGPENILITAGASQAVALATTLLVDPGDVVISEAPTWPGATRRFAVHGAEVREVAIDDQGMDVDELERVLLALRAEGRRAKLLYVLPNFQNPTGVTTTQPRRRRIIELANEHGLPIIEDDAYYDLRYDGDFLGTLYAIDPTDSVLYMGTFSKIMAAGIRLGWTVAHPDVIARMVALKHEGGTSPFASHVAAEWTRNGTLTSHISRLREHYRRGRDVMLESLEREMPEGASWTRPDGGFFIWLTLPEGCDAGRLAASLAERGVSVIPGTGFYASDRGQREVRLSYSFPTDDEIREGIRILGEETRKQMAYPGP